MVALTFTSLLALAATLTPIISALPNAARNVASCADITRRGVIVLTHSNTGLIITNDGGATGTKPGSMVSPQHLFPANGDVMNAEFTHTVKIDGVDSKVKCWITGTMAPGVQTVHFQIFKETKAYVDQCGARNGVTLTCGNDGDAGPAADCNGK